MTLQEALKVSGKARLSFWNSYMYIRYEPNDFCGGKFFDEKGVQTTLSPVSYLADKWEPYKEPCAHEPLDYDMKIFVERFERREYISFDQFKEFASIATVGNAKCKHCGAKIKAEKWVEA